MNISERIIIYNSLNNWWSYYLTFESMFREIESQNHVRWINIASKKKYSQVNKNDHMSNLIYKKMENKLKIFSNKYNLDMEENFIKYKKKYKLKNNITTNELRNYKINDFNIGAIIYAQLCGRLKSTDVNVKKNIRIINFYLNYGAEVYDKACKDIEKYNIKRVVVINDRVLASAAAISAARKKGIQTTVIYWGSGDDTYMEYEESLYSSNEWKKNIIRKWSESKINLYEKGNLQRKFEKEYKLISRQNSDFYLANMKKNGQIIIEKNKKTAVLYATSDWEYSAVYSDLSVQGGLGHQNESFYETAKYLLGSNWQVIIKIHPDIYSKKELNLPSEWARLQELPGLQFIGPLAKLDVNDLMAAIDLNIVWGSTVGLECIARRLPIMILGNSAWLANCSNLTVNDKDSLKRYVDSEEFIIDCECVVPYFYYLENYGSRFKYIEKINHLLIYRNFRIIEHTFIAKFYFRIKKPLKILQKLFLNNRIT